MALMVTDPMIRLLVVGTFACIAVIAWQLTQIIQLYWISKRDDATKPQVQQMETGGHENRS